MPFISCSYAAATYQPKLKKCDGTPMPAGTEIPTCDELDSAAAAATAAAIAAIPLATTTIPGLIEESTPEETRLGATDPNKDDRAVTPGSMSYALQTGKDYPISLATGTSSNTAAFINTLSNVNAASGTLSQINSIAGTNNAAASYNWLATGASVATSIGKVAGTLGVVASGVATPTGTVTEGVGGHNYSDGSGTKYGVVGDSGGSGGTNIGVYGRANGGTTNWAGYFDGNVASGAITTLSDATLKEDVQPIDPVKALAFRNGLKWKKYEMFTEQQVEILQDVTDSEGNTTQVPTGRYQAIRNSQGIKRGLIAQEVLALAQSIGDFTDVVVEVGEYFTLDAQGYPVKDAQGNNIVNKRLGIDYGSVNVIVMAGEQVAAPLAG
jgi:hypothetical protein